MNAACSAGRSAANEPWKRRRNNANDHLEVFELALTQMPPTPLDGPILVRSYSAGAGHAFADACRETRVRCSFGYAITETVRDALLALPKRAWQPAVNGDGESASTSGHKGHG
jgi:hypothetical protein